MTSPPFDMDLIYLRKDNAGKDLFAEGEAGLTRHISAEMNKLGHPLNGDTSDYDRVVLCLGGNTHNTLGLIKLDPPFDYVLSTNESVETNVDAFLIPERIIRDIIKGKVQNFLDGLKTIKDLFIDKVVFIESPPPIGDDEYVRAYLDEYFIKAFPEGREIVSPALRYKLWRTASGIYQSRCEEIDIPYLKCPASAMIDGMYLKKEGYPDNVTHGNAWYGERVLENLASWMATHDRGTV